jgi:transcriptional regulator GlxA family with amidase domain
MWVLRPRSVVWCACGRGIASARGNPRGEPRRSGAACRGGPPLDRSSCHRRPGSDALVCKLSEFLFVDALRQFVSDAQGPLKGWLAGLRDPAISNALALLHRRPQENWDIRALASACARSRSSFVPRVSKIVGLPPKKYLARWRMILAARDLRDRNSSVVQVAGRYGYGSEASFTRAFRRLFDVPPATYRRAEHGRAEVSR